jgi:hypothetical protein
LTVVSHCVTKQQKKSFLNLKIYSRFFYRESAPQVAVKRICELKTTQKEIATQFRVKSSFAAFKPTDNSVLGKDKGYREKETPAPQ